MSHEDLKRLGHEMAQAQGSPEDDPFRRTRQRAAVDQAWQARRSRARSPTRWVWVAGSAGLAALGSVALLLAMAQTGPTGPVAQGPRTGDSERQTRAGVRHDVSTAARGKRIALSAASFVQVGPRSSAVVTTRGDRVQLERGSVHLSIEPSEHRNLSVHAGPFRVDVVGTVFSVEYVEGERFEVAVDRGKVRVFGPELAAGGEPVAAGERLRRSLGPVRAGRIELAEDEGPTDPTGAPNQSGVERRSVRREHGSPDPQPSTGGLEGRGGNPWPVGARSGAGSADAGPDRDWKAPARRSQFSVAYRRAAQSDLLQIARTATPQDGMLLADVARLSGHPEDAQKVLEILVRRFADVPLVQRGLFQLGVMSADVDKDPEAAHRWFSRYLEQGLDRSLEEEARGRSVELLLEMGRTEAARTEAKAYLRRHRSGPRAETFRALLED